MPQKRYNIVMSEDFSIENSFVMPSYDPEYHPEFAAAFKIFLHDPSLAIIKVIAKSLKSAEAVAIAEMQVFISLYPKGWGDNKQMNKYIQGMHGAVSETEVTRASK